MRRFGSREVFVGSRGFASVRGSVSGGCRNGERRLLVVGVGIRF